MLEFKIYGIQNDKYYKLLLRLEEAMEKIYSTYRVERIHDVDEIVSSGALSVPALFLHDIPLAENHIPDVEQLRISIRDAIKSEMESSLNDL
jgi:hypothetical protein